MADDITLTVRVRDMTRGDFDRLKGRLEGMKRELQGVDRSTDSAGMHSKRLGQDIDKLNNSFEKMERTGNLSQRELTKMKGSLDAMSRSALQAHQSGEITSERFRNINDEVGRLRGELNRLDSGLQNNTRTLRTHNNQTRTTIRYLNGMVRSVNQTTRSVNGNTRVINTWRRDMNRVSSASNSVSNAVRRSGDSGTIAGKAFGNMHAKLIGIAAVLIASLLPTIGALAPMLAGVGAVAGVAALAFSGLDKPTKKLSQSQKDFLKGLKPLKKEFDGLRKSAQDAVLPELTKHFGDVGKAMKSLNPVIGIAGKTIGDLVGKIAKGISSKDFMGPFLQNVKMGTTWLEQFARSFGTFTKAFFEFGTKSQPALNAWQDLLGGFLDRGLPSMFTAMESGIKGSSDYLRGLSALINDGLLPGLGSLIGKFMQAFGPTIGKFLTQFARYFNDASHAAGELFVALGPLVSIIGDVVSGMLDFGRIQLGSVVDMVKELGGALLKTFVEVFSGPTKNPFAGLSTWVQDNEGPIRNMFTQISVAFVQMVSAMVQEAPIVTGILDTMARTAISFVSVWVNGMAAMFGDIPGIGSKFKDAAKGFNDFASSTIRGLDTLHNKASEFASKAIPNLTHAEFSIKVDAAERNLADIKKQLQDPNLTKTRRAELLAEKKQAESALSDAKRKLASFDQARATAKLDANNSSFFGSFNAARNAKIPNKRANITANTGGFWGSIRGLIGRVLGTSYINVVKRISVQESRVSSTFSNANGSIMKFFANGGENHTAQIAPAGAMRVWAEPETGGEAYIPLSPSKRNRSRAIAEDTVDILGGDVEWFAHGGTHRRRKKKKRPLTKAQKAAKAQAAAEKQARSDAAGDLTISHFGKMAGYKNDEFRHALGLPQSLGSLVDSLNHWRSVILKSTHGGMEKSLLKQLDRAGKSLIKYEKSLSKVNSSLDKAKTNLDNLKQAAASLRDSVTSGVMSSTDITKVASGDKNVTMTDIMSTMRQNTDKASAFSSALAALKKKGVSGDVIAQIAQAGIDGGGMETAGALLNASDAQVKQINEMQKKINSSAKSAGKTAADAMYAAGIKAAQGLVDGLTKKQKAIEKKMMDIAKAMERAIKKALGIHSPSRVMMGIGHHTAEGFALGIKKNQSVDDAWQSMLNTGPTGGGSVSGGGGSPQIIQLVMSGRVVDEIILDSNRRTVRTRGGNVQAVYGRKNG